MKRDREQKRELQRQCEQAIREILGPGDGHNRNGSDDAKHSHGEEDSLYPKYSDSAYSAYQPVTPVRSNDYPHYDASPSTGPVYPSLKSSDEPEDAFDIFQRI
jgi:hypothetical protein